MTAIAENALHAIAQEVVNPEISFPRIDAGKIVIRFGIRTDRTYKELLRARDHLGAAHGLLPESDLAEPVRSFDPISAALEGTCELRAQIQRNFRGLPSHVEAKCVAASVLQGALPGSAGLKPRAGKKESHASADVPL